MSTARRFAGDVVVRTGFQALNALKGLVFLPLIARLFGATGYSIWSQIFLTITFLAPLITLRMDAGLVRYLGGQDKGQERSRTFFSAAVPVWALSLLLLVGSLLARSGLSFVLFADSGELEYSVLFSVLLVTRVNFTFVSSYYRAVSAIRLYTVIQTVQILLEIAALYTIALGWGRGLDTALWSFVIIEAALTLSMLVSIVAENGWPPGLSRDVLVRLLRFSLPLIPAAAMYWVVNSSDRYVIVHLIGLEQAGVYSAAYRVAQILKLMLQPISFVLLPLVSSLWERNERGKAQAYLSRSILWFLLLAIPAAAGLISIGPQLLRTLGTEAFTVSRGLIALLVLGELCVGIYQIYVYIIYLFEKTWILIVLFAVLGALNLGLNLVLVPRIGILGAAATTFGAYALQAVLVIAYTDRLARLRLDWSRLGKAFLGGMCVLLSTLFLPARGVLGLIGSVVLGIAVYSVILWVTGAVRRGDLRSILSSTTNEKKGRILDDEL